jgi:hypothetical protein
VSTFTRVMIALWPVRDSSELEAGRGKLYLLLEPQCSRCCPCTSSDTIHTRNREGRYRTRAMRVNVICTSVFGVVVFIGVSNSTLAAWAAHTRVTKTKDQLATM